MRLRVALSASLALALPALACNERNQPPAPAGFESKEVVARLDGTDITEGELETWIKDQLYEREMGDKAAGEIYEAKTRAIDELIAERILAQAAAKASQTPDEYLKAQADALGPVTDAEVKTFFEQNKARLPADATLETIGPRIKAHLEAQRPETVRIKLLEAAEVAVLIQPPRADVAATGPSKGPENAPVTVIEFSDYQCPFCKRAEPTIQAVLEKYPSQVRVVFRHLPLDGLHPRARAASIAAVCAENQGKFWPYHDQLFANQTAMSDEDLDKYATAAGLDLAAFKTCRQSPEAAARVQADADAARAVGITGTPAFLINGILISGARPLEDFSKWIDQEIKASEAAAAPAPAEKPAS
jgi:protein-disulfide isomerase